MTYDELDAEKRELQRKRQALLDGEGDIKPGLRAKKIATKNRKIAAKQLEMNALTRKPHEDTETRAQG